MNKVDMIQQLANDFHALIIYSVPSRHVISQPIWTGDCSFRFHLVVSEVLVFSHEMRLE